MAHYKTATKKEIEPQEEVANIKGTPANVPVSIDSQAKLAMIMNDSPTIAKLGGTEWEIRCLRNGTQMLIAEEACKMVKKENATMGDVIKEFAVNMSSVVRVIVLALLNDKERINSEEYDRTYDMLMWGDFKAKDWAQLLVEILGMLDVDFFFLNTRLIQTVRIQALERKMTIAEVKSSLQEPVTDK